jgi:hypothetical protein
MVDKNTATQADTKHFASTSNSSLELLTFKLSSFLNRPRWLSRQIAFELDQQLSLIFAGETTG